MPLQTLEYLCKGVPGVVDWWEAAVLLWDKLLADELLWEDEEFGQLARIFSESQLHFEQRCGGRQPGKEIMVWSFFGRLYDTGSGFGSNEVLARAGVEAFGKSSCSREVKFAAAKAAEAYRLEG